MIYRAICYCTHDRIANAPESIVFIQGRSPDQAAARLSRVLADIWNVSIDSVEFYNLNEESELFANALGGPASGDARFFEIGSQGAAAVTVMNRQSSFRQGVCTMLIEPEANTACNDLGCRQIAVASAPSRHATKRCRQPSCYQLAHDLRAICRRNPQGAHRTQVDRLRTLLLCARQLDRRKKAINLTADDIRLLVHRWHADRLAASTIRFRLLCLRWLARKIGKPEIVGPDRAYGVDRDLR